MDNKKREADEEAWLDFPSEESTSNSSSSEGEEDRLHSLALPSGRPIVKPTIGQVPPSSILTRIREFLPELRKANEQLIEQDPASYNIEQPIKTVESGNRVIEMNLGIGAEHNEEPSQCSLFKSKRENGDDNHKAGNNDDYSNEDSSDDDGGDHSASSSDGYNNNKILEFD